MWQYNELYHHGIQGQKWGVRRYQNPDGTLTEEGLARYRKKEARIERKAERKETRKLRNEVIKSLEKEMPAYKKNIKWAKDKFKEYRTGPSGIVEYSKASLKEKRKMGKDFVDNQLEMFYGPEKAKALAAHYERKQLVSGSSSAGSMAIATALSLIGGAPIGFLGGAISGAAGGLIGGGAAVAATNKEYKKHVDNYADYLKRQKEP